MTWRELIELQKVKVYSVFLIKITIYLWNSLMFETVILNTRENFLHGLWNPEVQCRIRKGFPVIPILRRIYPFPRIDKILETLPPTSILTTWPPHLNLSHPGYIMWTIQTVKFLIMEPSALPILITIGTKKAIKQK